MLLKNLKEIPNSAILLFLNKNKAKGFIASTSSSRAFIVKFLSNVENGGNIGYGGFTKKDLEETEVIVLNGKSDRNILKEYIDNYTKKGIDIVCNQKIPNYKVKITVIDYKAYVYLRTSGNRRIICGIFDKMNEAEKFAKIIKEQKYIRPIFANNEFTKEYYKIPKRKIL